MIPGIAAVAVGVVVSYNYWHISVYSLQIIVIVPLLLRMKDIVSHSLLYESYYAGSSYPIRA